MTIRRTALTFFGISNKKSVHTDEMSNSIVKKRLPTALTTESLLKVTALESISVLQRAKSLDQGSVINPEPKRPALVAVIRCYHELASAIVSVNSDKHFSFSLISHALHLPFDGLENRSGGHGNPIKKLCHYAISTNFHHALILSRVKNAKNLCSDGEKYAC